MLVKFKNFKCVTSKFSLITIDNNRAWSAVEGSWRSGGYCYLNKGECNLNQSKGNSFVERVAKINS